MKTKKDPTAQLPICPRHRRRDLLPKIDGWEQLGNWNGVALGSQTTPSAYLNGYTYTFVRGGGSEPSLCYNVTAGGTPIPIPPTPTPTPSTCLVTTITARHCMDDGGWWNTETCECEFPEHH